MMTKQLLLRLALMAAMLAPFVAQAQQSKAISDFKLIDARSQQPVMLSTFKSKPGVVLIFTSNYCPYSKLYESRIASLVAQYPDVQLLLVNSNDPVRSKDDSIEEMALKAKNSNYGFPYLADKGQVVSNLLGATKTPEAFLLQYSGGVFKVMYYGAIDDNPQNERDVKVHFLQEAIEALQNRAAQPRGYVRPTGCMIKKG